MGRGRASPPAARTFTPGPTRRRAHAPREIEGLFAQCGWGGPGNKPRRLVASAVLRTPRDGTVRRLDQMEALTVDEAQRISTRLSRTIIQNKDQAARRAALQALYDGIQAQWSGGQDRAAQGAGQQDDGRARVSGGGRHADQPADLGASISASSTQLAGRRQAGDDADHGVLARPKAKPHRLNHNA